MGRSRKSSNAAAARSDPIWLARTYRLRTWMTSTSIRCGATSDSAGSRILGNNCLPRTVQSTNSRTTDASSTIIADLAPAEPLRQGRDRAEQVHAVQDDPAAPGGWVVLRIFRSQPGDNQRGTCLSSRPVPWAACGLTPEHSESESRLSYN